MTLRNKLVAFLAALAMVLSLGGLAAGSASARSSTPPTYGACSAYLDGDYKVVNHYVYQCQYVWGIGYLWVLIGYYYCGPARQDSPGRCT